MRDIWQEPGGAWYHTNEVDGMEGPFDTAVDAYIGQYRYVRGNKLLEPPDMRGDVLDFHVAMCKEQIAVRPSIPDPRIKKLRIGLILEECAELIEALIYDDLVRIADGAADLKVVVLGTEIAYGIPSKRVWEEVHRTNMAKTTGPVRADGKRLKPDGWQPPNIPRILTSVSDGVPLAMPISDPNPGDAYSWDVIMALQAMQQVLDNAHLPNDYREENASR